MPEEIALELETTARDVRDILRMAQQPEGGILPVSEGDIRRHDRVERHAEAPGRKG